MTTPDALAVRRRIGTVSAVDQTTTIPTATVTWADTVTLTAGIAHLASYQPAVGDIVAVDLADGSPLIVGTIGARRVACRLRRVANQSIPNNGGGPTSISWDTEDSDPYGFIAVTSATITIPAGLGGTYDILARDTGNFGGRSFGNIPIVSSLTGVSGTFRTLPDNVTAGIVTVALPGIPLAAGDNFTFDIYQSSGAAANHTAWINVVRVGP